ncbi:hypothetical protein ACRRTK_010022 [Alexandromys fortis]
MNVVSDRVLPDVLPPHLPHFHLHRSLAISAHHPLSQSQWPTVQIFALTYS